ncbi:Forkhead-associated (FHA) domain [Dillenia turbinata]|uniref:Forkhead-associated (FHA) domain n=1 Tax=Dillenia turbinata TaxID=194707 RepID=A0AAN8UGP0_9MAGN
MVWGLFPSDPHSGEDGYYIFCKGTYKVGRKGCEVIINKDKGVSRVHAEIYVDSMATPNANISKLDVIPAPVRIRDGSKYGTVITRSVGLKEKIHEFPNKEANMKDGDLISFGTGNATYRFSLVPLVFFVYCSGKVSPSLEDKVSAIDEGRSYEGGSNERDSGGSDEGDLPKRDLGLSSGDLMKGDQAKGALNEVYVLVEGKLLLDSLGISLHYSSTLFYICKKIGNGCFGTTLIMATFEAGNVSLAKRRCTCACISKKWSPECTHVLVDGLVPVKEDLVDAVAAKKQILLDSWVEVNDYLLLPVADGVATLQ